MQLSRVEEILLGVGLKYLPIPASKAPFSALPSVLKAKDEFIRRIALRLYFCDLEDDTRTIRPPKNTFHPWSPNDLPQQPILDDYSRRLRENLTEVICMRGVTTFPALDRFICLALQRLRLNTSIVIKAADKNLGLVVMNREDYIEMCLTHLRDATTYEITEQFHYHQCYARLRIILKSSGRLFSNATALDKDRKLTPLSKSLLQGESGCRMPPFYCLPKMHKNVSPPPGRPIVSACGSLSYATSQYADTFFRKYLPAVQTICTSSDSVLPLLDKCQPDDTDIVLCADVTALYPSIPIVEGLALVMEYCTARNLVPFQELCFHQQLLRWVLENNYFEFLGVTYHQIKGTAMGTPVAVTFAQLFLAAIELPILSKLEYKLYLRYIDDIFGVMSLKTALDFVASFNERFPSIKLDAVTTTRDGVFLDMHITLTGPPQNVVCKLYQKAQNRYQYIPPCSNHSPAVLKQWVLQEAKRYRLKCSLTSDYMTACVSFNDRLKARGYDSSCLSRVLPMVHTRETLLAQIKPPSIIETPSPVRPCEPPVLVLTLPGVQNPQPNWRTLLQLPEDLLADPQYIQQYGRGNLKVRILNNMPVSTYLTRSRLILNHK